MSSHRASLLTGLRTGGPRSVSNGAYNNAPQTAQVGGQFPHTPSYPTYDRDELAYGGIPMTAPAKDVAFSNFQQQQQNQLMLLQQAAVQNAVMANQGNMPYGLSPEQQAFQLQIEVYKMQALQQQQLQAQLLAQAQMQMQQQQQQQLAQPRRRPSEPTTAGPYMTTFGGAPRNRTISTLNETPMTAAIDGRFGSANKPGLNPNATSFQFGGGEPTVPPTPSGQAAVSTNWRSVSQPVAPASTPATANFTGVISGGTLLGAAVPVVGAAPAAKHTAATSWRRPSVAKVDTSRTPSPDGSSGLSASPPTVYVSTPDETSPIQSRSISPPAIALRARPQPLRFNVPVTITDEPEEYAEGSQVLPLSPRFNESPSSPSTPTSGSSMQSAAREEAARRLYEGLGIGRPAPVQQQAQAQSEQRLVSSQPARQPRGPPSGVEDLGARNFAARIRRKAIGGLGVLVDARNRRSSMIEVEAY